MYKKLLYPLLVLAVCISGCAGEEKQVQGFDDVSLRQFLDGSYPGMIEKANSLVFLLHNEDCSCVEDEFKIAEKALANPQYKSYNIIILMQKDKEPFWEKIKTRNNTFKITTTPNEMVQRGIIVSMNRFLRYEGGKLIEMKDFKNLL
jgi:hypothetical protein